MGHKPNQPTGTQVSQAKQAKQAPLDAEKATREGGLLFLVRFESSALRNSVNSFNLF
jgi:hypothetical protein